MDMKKNLKIKKQKILVILGPTACGKSDLAVSFAKKLNGEVVSADSRQVYRGMDIGTGKITRREMRGVPHHLLDVADPKRRFTAENYRFLARAAIDDITSRGKLPIVCGGTGFYIDAIFDEDPFPNVPPDEGLRKKLEKKGPASLLLILKRLDKKRWRAIVASDSEKKNARRIVRAIEVATASLKRSRGTGGITMNSERVLVLDDISPAETVSECRPLRHKYAPIFIGVKPSYDELKKRIRSRLLKRLRHGMLAEARRLHDGGLSWKRMDELGLEYRYEALYLQGKMSKEDFVERLNTAIWHFARRQMTWFRRNRRIQWFEAINKVKIRV